MSFHSFRCHSIHSDVILLIPMSLHSFQSHIIHTNLITSFWRHSIHSDVIPFILSCLRWPRNDFISEWREWPWNANFSHSRLILVILCYPRWSRKDGIFPFSSLSFQCHSVIRTSFWDQESIEMRSEWRMIWGRSRQSSLRATWFREVLSDTCLQVEVSLLWTFLQGLWSGLYSMTRWIASTTTPSPYKPPGKDPSSTLSFNSSKCFFTFHGNVGLCKNNHD